MCLQIYHILILSWYKVFIMYLYIPCALYCLDKDIIFIKYTCLLQIVCGGEGAGPCHLDVQETEDVLGHDSPGQGPPPRSAPGHLHPSRQGRHGYIILENTYTIYESVLCGNNKSTECLK